MRRIVTSVDINASVSAVWAALTDLHTYAAWNPFIVRASGELAPGARLRLTMQLPGGKPSTFSPRVATVDAGKELRWVGTLGAAFLFRGEHYFYVTALDGERCRLTHGEEFSGALVPLVSSMIPRTLQGFHAMNAALKEYVERA